MFGLSFWERGLKKLDKSPSLTEATIINKFCGIEKGGEQFFEMMKKEFGGAENIPEHIKRDVEPKEVKRIDIEFTTVSGITKQLHCGGTKAEKLYHMEIGDKVTVEYAEYKGEVFARLKEDM